MVDLNSAPRSSEVTGTILRKKKVSSDYLRLAIQPLSKCSECVEKSDGINDTVEKSITVFINRNNLASVFKPLDHRLKLGSDDTPASVEFNFLYLSATVHVKWHNFSERSAPLGVTNIVQECILIRCAPDVKMIKEVLELDNYKAFAKTLGMKDGDALEKLLRTNTTKLAIMHIIRQLRNPSSGTNDGEDIEWKHGSRTKAPRYRIPKLKLQDMEILNAKEKEGQNEMPESKMWTMNELRQSDIFIKDVATIIDCNTSASTNLENHHVILNLPDGAENVVSTHGVLTRLEYLQKKKNNQTRWFIERLRKFPKMAKVDSGGDRPIRLLDVGGGRGDLAVQIALNFSNAEVVVVDCNESSISAGMEYAKKCNVLDRIDFCNEDFSQYVEKFFGEGDHGKSKNTVDIVLALHACGDLSDLALSFAQSNRCDFIICPCCYTKRYLAPFTPHWHGFCEEHEIVTLSRLAELDHQRHASQRAMVVINSMRISAFEDQDVQLEEFDGNISKRNIALVGELKETPQIKSIS